MKTENKISQKITPFLWFDNQAEKAINFYTSIFDNSEILQLKKWPEGGPFPSDTIQTGSFILDGGGSESMCGWLQDKFGVWWQIVPEFISDKMANGNPARVGNMMQALGKMKKLIIKDLEDT